MNILGQNDKTERVGYDTQKPKSLIERIIKSSSDDGDLELIFIWVVVQLLWCVRN